MPERTCTIDGCDNPFNAQGLCHTHYVAARRDGLPALDRSHLHRLTEIDREARLATCSICGPGTPIVDLKRAPACAIKRRQRRRTTKELEYQREYQRRWRFRLAPGGVEKLLDLVDWHCELCERPLDATTARIDHDHTCCPPRTRTCGNCIRGILCNSCNTVLGMLADNPALFIKAAGYLGREKRLDLSA